MNITDEGNQEEGPQDLIEVRSQWFLLITYSEHNNLKKSFDNVEHALTRSEISSYLYLIATANEWRV
jgi:hypothetical protein